MCPAPSTNRALLSAIRCTSRSHSCHSHKDLQEPGHSPPFRCTWAKCKTAWKRALFSLFLPSRPRSWQPGLHTRRCFPSASSLEASPETCSVSYPFSVRWQAFSSVTFTLTVVLLLLLECFDLSHGRCHKLVFTKLNTRGLSVLAWRRGFRWLRPHWGGSRLIAGARVQRDSRPKCHLKQKWK